MNVTDVALAATTTVDGEFRAAGAVLLMVITAPPAGAALSKVAVQVVL